MNDALTWPCREHLLLRLQSSSPPLLQATRTARLPQPHHGAVPGLTPEPDAPRPCRRLLEPHGVHELGPVSNNGRQSVTVHTEHIGGMRRRNQVN